MMRKGIALVGCIAGILSTCAGTASAAPPAILSVGVAEEKVTDTGVELLGTINPEGLPTTYRFEYLTAAAYEANLEADPPRDPFSGALLAPEGGPGPVGFDTSPHEVRAPVHSLAPSTSYRFRLRATNSVPESVVSVERPFATKESTPNPELLDHRGWEMVSPIDKAGGAIQPPGTIFGGGVFQAADGGESFTYSSADSFGGAPGAPPGSQYIATRTGGGWTSANITAPLLSGSYGSELDGVPYQLFSDDLRYGLLSNGERCRGVEGGECPVANPPLPGSGAPAGYRDYYRRTAAGGFESLLKAAELEHTSLRPEQFELRLVAATPDLAHVVLSTCAALTADATEVTAPGGCAPGEQNLYEWSGGTLSLINRLPGETTGTPGATIAAPGGAMSNDGSRVYFTAEGDVYLSEAGTTKTVLGTPGGKFEAAAADGSIAYLIDSGELDRYSATTGTLTPLASGGGVEGVLGVSADGSKAYYARSGAIFLRDGSTVTEIASSAVPGDWPAATGTARITEDGRHLLFLSTAELTGYPNEGETEVFLYGPPSGGSAPTLACISCNPSGERPRGSATIPAARRNGTGTDAIDSYKPRALSADGRRVFFETADSISVQDTSGATDVYEWEAAGEGTCARGGGCVQLISGGRDPQPSYFLDADRDGGEAFFLTAGSLFPLDPGSYDVYDAREYGGFAVPESRIPCFADACQVIPEAPEDPTPGTLAGNSGNPGLTIAGGKGSQGRSGKRKHKKRRRHKSGRHSKHKGSKR